MNLAQALFQTKMKELSLFSGAGGGVYGSKLLGWSTVGYVEWEDYPQQIIAQRIKDGIFDEAPIFSDVRAFVSQGYARRYRGMVDVVTGGFPCQPFSVAGKRKASDDSRDMWPATMDVIKAVKPPIVYLENVPGLLSATVDDGAGRPIHYFGTILRDLAESGYDVKWCVLGADDVGARHHRKRLWILGVHADTEHNGSLAASKRGSERPPVFNEQEGPYSTREFTRVDSSRNVAHSTRKLSHRCLSERWQKRRAKLTNLRKIPYNAASKRRRSWNTKRQNASHARQLGISQRQYAEGVASWNIEPLLGRVANGVADRSNRLKAIGNGQVSLTMACAYEILFAEFINENKIT